MMIPRPELVVIQGKRIADAVQQKCKQARRDWSLVLQNVQSSSSGNSWGSSEIGHALMSVTQGLKTGNGAFDEQE